MIISAWRSARKAGIISSGLRSRLVQATGMFLVLLVLATTGCRLAPALPPAVLRAALEDDLLRLELSEVPSRAQLAIEDREGRLVQVLPLREGALEQVLAFRPDPGVRYRVRLLLANSLASGPPLEVVAPDASPLRAVLHLPYGQARQEILQTLPSLVALAEQGSRVQVGIELELRARAPWQVRVSLETSPPGILVDTGELVQILEPGQAPFLWLPTLLLPTSSDAVELRVLLDAFPRSAHSDAAALSPWPRLPPPVRLAASARLITRSPEDMRDLLAVTAVSFPTDREGQEQSWRQSGSVVLPGALWRRLGALLRAPSLSYDPYAPYGFLTARFANRSPWPLTLILTTRVELEDGSPAQSFVPRAFEVTGGTGTVTSLSRIPARGEGLGVLPVYADLETLEGRYRQVVEVRLLGSEALLHRIERPLEVFRTQLRVNLSLMLAIPVALAGLGLFALTYRRLMQSLSVHALTTLALFGALMFGAGFLLELLSVGLNAFLGPFNLLITGMAFECLHHLLLASLLVLYPRAGVVALVGLTQYLLRGLTTAQLSPVDLFFVGSALGFKELALYGLGVTRGRKVLQASALSGARALDPWAVADPLGSSSAFEPERSRAWRARLLAALVLASAVTAYTALGLHSAFYRLYFADWYVWMAVGVGILGPIPGIWLGTRFGRSLRRIQE